jgi:hypothetical protein
MSNKQPIEPLDTVKLAKTVHQMLKEAGITIKSFAHEVLDISVSFLEVMLYRPKPWAKINKNRKLQYQKMHEWSKLNEELVESKRASINVNGNIDTILLTDKISEILKEGPINKEMLAKDVLGIPKPECSFYHSLYKPVLWEKCNYSTKIMYIKLYEWCKSHEESIQPLKASTFSDESIDTAKLAKTIKDMLDDANISLEFFAAEFMTISYHTLTVLLDNSKGWAQCSKIEKMWYCKMYEWSQAPGSVKKLKVLDIMDDNIYKIDTFKLANLIKNILRDNQIQLKTFATEVLSISPNMLYSTLNKPFPWNQCKGPTKLLFQKMYEWSQLPDKSTKPFKTSTDNNKDNVNNIDTVKLINAVLQTLKDANIYKCVFAKEILGISRENFKSLVLKAKPWAQTRHNTKKVLCKMHEWSTSPNESIPLLQALSGSVDNVNQIDTIKLAKEITNKLEEENILKTVFLKEVSGYENSSTMKKLHRPKPWVDCKVQTKREFQKMYDWWTLASEESFKSLKTLSYGTRRVLSSKTALLNKTKSQVEYVSEEEIDEESFESDEESDDDEEEEETW